MHPDALAAGTRLHEYEVKRPLGEGGFALVYLAFDHLLAREVALKEYMPLSLAARGPGHSVAPRSARTRETFEVGLRSFVNEARALAQFDHPALVKVHRFWEAQGTAYMVMPFYEGFTLKQAVRSLAQPPDEAWLLRLLDPLTEALAVVHAAHWYHRDIAPDNIMLLAGSGAPLLLDFGAARQVLGESTQALTAILKPGYAPVEQYAEVPGMKQGAWTDVYALAATVYWVITGRTPPASVGRMLQDTHQPLLLQPALRAGGAYSERFLRANDQGLGVRPDERTPSIAEFRAALGLEAAEVDIPLSWDLPPQDAAVPPHANGPAVTHGRSDAAASSSMKGAATTRVRPVLPSPHHPSRRRMGAGAMAMAVAAGALVAGAVFWRGPWTAAVPPVDFARPAASAATVQGAAASAHAASGHTSAAASTRSRDADLAGGADSEPSASHSPQQEASERQAAAPLPPAPSLVRSPSPSPAARAEPAPAPKRQHAQTAKASTTCASLMQRVSLGDDSPELAAQMARLGCR